LGGLGGLTGVSGITPSYNLSNALIIH